MTRTLKTIGSAVLACAVAACSGQTSSSSAEQSAVHKLGQPYVAPGDSQNLSAASAGNLKYYGGPVISNVNVVAVNWNANVDATMKNGLPGFYQAVVQSELIDWLDSEYATTLNANVGSHSGSPGTNQHIGRGTYGGQFTLSQSATTVQDADIQSALQAAISAGTLPAPDANTIYMVHFPQGTSITSSDGGQSCVGGGFCAYHSTYAASSSLHVKYGVLPDMSVDCNQGCGNDASYFNNGTSVASHELIEAITDADVGLVPNLATQGYNYPCAWGGSGEIGDLCNAQQGQLAATQPNGTHYVVQKEFDNATGQCIVSKAVSGFTVGVSPTAVSVQAGGSSGSATITTSGTGTIALTVTGAPAGVSATPASASVTAGSSTTLTITAQASATAGNYTLTITGSSGGTSHSATVALTVTGSGTTGASLANGGFESGLSGWTTSGTTAAATSGCHGGAGCAQLGATTATNGDSSVAQTFTAPSNATGLGFFYKVTCPDTVSYDWATATLKDNTSGVTSTVLAKTCVASGAWTQVTAALSGGHNYTLTLTSHDDNYAGDPTYTLFDDVTITTGGTTGGGSLTNGGFESGSSGWTTAGTASVATSGCHGGAGCAQAGSSSPTNGDSSFAQTFTAPAGASKLSFWYRVTCPDTVSYDWATATLKDNASGATTTVLAKTCTAAGAWTQVTSAITAGHSYTLTLTSHDDNYSGDPTYTLFDDVAVQ